MEWDGSGGMSKSAYGFWTIVIRTSQLFRAEMILENMGGRGDSPFEFEVGDLDLDASEPICTVHFHCTKEVMEQICEELKSVCIDIL